MFCGETEGEVSCYEFSYLGECFYYLNYFFVLFVFMLNVLMM